MDTPTSDNIATLGDQGDHAPNAASAQGANHAAGVTPKKILQETLVVCVFGVALPLALLAAMECRARVAFLQRERRCSHPADLLPRCPV